MRVCISDLRRVTEKLLAHVEQKYGPTVEIDADYYWNIPEDSRLERYEQPSELDLGQLTDDWSEIQKIVLGEKEPISYDLVWVSAILRTLGEKLVS